MKSIKNLAGILVVVLAMAILPGSCRKEPSDPNENWVAGEEWVDARDGYAYATVQIGEQVWMAENFHFKPDSGSWAYENQESNAAVYGRMYDWETAVRICPSGWHLPLIEEWQGLIDYLGGSETAGGKLKERGTSHWDEPNEGATNSTGFSALPGGHMWYVDRFSEIGMYAHFWSSSKYSYDYYAYSVTLNWLDSYIIQSGEYLKGSACAVRYIRD